jgi:hypothetical protein
MVNPLKSAASKAVADAARLMLYCGARWQDEADTAGGWSTYYAVDTDVLTMFSNPSLGSEYGIVFSHDSQEDHVALADLLGTFLIQKLSHVIPQAVQAVDAKPRPPLVLLQPHAEELDRIRLRVVENLLATAELAVEQMSELIERYPSFSSTSASDIAKIADYIQNHLSELIQYFDGKTPAQVEAIRLGSVGKRCIHLDRALSVFGSSPSDRSMLPPSTATYSPERDVFNQLVKEWRRLLTAHLPKQKPRHALIRDAIALATLQWVNEIWKPQQKRLVLITGSRNIFEAASQRDDGFSETYLRHPQAFIGCKDFFPGGAADRTRSDEPALPKTVGFRLQDWLNLFFPDVLKHEGAGVIGVNKGILRSIVAGKRKELNEDIALLARLEYHEKFSERSGRQFPADLLRDWSTLVRVSMPLEEAPDQNRARVLNFLKWIKSKFEESWTIEDVRSEFTDRATEAAIGLYVSAGTLGFLQLWNSNDEPTVRGLPALRFDEPYSEAQKVSREIVKQLETHSDDTFDLSEMYSRLNAQDPDHYHAYVLHAFAYAACGHWVATRTLCRVALRVVEKIPIDLRQGRMGREAAYLWAVAERRLAKRIEDIEVKAKQVLQIARERDDKNLVGNQDIRFRSEAFAQTVVKFQFDCFLERITEHTSSQLPVILAEAKSIIECARSDNLDQVRLWVIRQTCVNAFAYSLAMLHMNSAVASEDQDSIRRLAQIYIENDLYCDEAAGSGFTDSFADIVYLTARTVFLGLGDNGYYASIALHHRSFHLTVLG